MNYLLPAIGGVFISKLIRKCGCCSDPIDILDKYTDVYNLLFISGTFYHKKCYMESNEIKKKCKHCKKEMKLAKNKEDSVLYDGAFFHSSCFDEWCKATKKPSKKRMNALKNKSNYVDAAKDYVSTVMSNKDSNCSKYNIEAINKIESMKGESSLNKHIKETYGLTSISSQIWKKLDGVYKGSYKSLDVPIPPEHLLDMWRRKQGYLNKIYQKNITKGNKMDNTQRVLYDISILINQYDSYLNWLEKQKINENKNVTNMPPDNPNNLYMTNVLNKEKHTDEDVSNIIEEVF